MQIQTKKPESKREEKVSVLFIKKRIPATRKPSSVTKKTRAKYQSESCCIENIEISNYMQINAPLKL
jgi:hypothetical protein